MSKIILLWNECSRWRKVYGGNHLWNSNKFEPGMKMKKWYKDERGDNEDDETKWKCLKNVTELKLTAVTRRRLSRRIIIDCWSSKTGKSWGASVARLEQKSSDAVVNCLPRVTRCLTESTVSLYVTVRGQLYRLHKITNLWLLSLTSRIRLSPKWNSTTHVNNDTSWVETALQYVA